MFQEANTKFYSLSYKFFDGAVTEVKHRVEPLAARVARRCSRELPRALTIDDSTKLKLRYHRESDNERKAKADKDFRLVRWAVQGRLSQGGLLVLLNTLLSHRIPRTLRRH